MAITRKVKNTNINFFRTSVTYQKAQTSHQCFLFSDIPGQQDFFPGISCSVGMLREISDIDTESF